LLGLLVISILIFNAYTFGIFDFKRRKKEKEEKNLNIQQQISKELSKYKIKDIENYLRKRKLEKLK
jgi:hypothetical protein